MPSPEEVAGHAVFLRGTKRRKSLVAVNECQVERFPGVIAQIAFRGDLEAQSQPLHRSAPNRDGFPFRWRGHAVTRFVGDVSKAPRADR